MKGRRSVLVSCVAVILFAGCGDDVRSGWVRHDDVSGFTMQFPEGWQATLTRSPRSFVIRAVDAQSGAFVVVSPVPPDARSAEDCVRAVTTFLPGLFAEVTVTEVESVGGGPTARGKLNWTADDTRWRASVMCAKRGRAGMLYATAAPAETFDERRDTLIEILESFRFAAPKQPDAAEPASTPAVTYVRWADPKEKAFTIDVPKGWKIEGGLIRFNAVDPRAVVGATSPDARVKVQFGDASHPTCIEPGFSPYFPEGSWYSPGYGVKMFVKRYRTGEMYAREFVERAVADQYTKLRFVKSTDLADKVAVINRIYAQQSPGVVNSSLSLGEVAFTCEENGKPMRGTCVAMTRRTASTAGVIWNIESLTGFVAPHWQAPQAGAVAEHMVKSFRLSPAWVRMQQNLTASVSGIVAKTNAEISSIISDGYWSRQAVDDDVARKRSNAILGLTDLVDEETGETYKVESGSNYYWSRPGGGTVVGTETADRPGIDFAPLKAW